MVHHPPLHSIHLGSIIDILLMIPWDNVYLESNPQVFLRLEDEHRISCYPFCSKIWVCVYTHAHRHTYVSAFMWLYVMHIYISCVHSCVHDTHNCVCQASKLLKKIYSNFIPWQNRKPRFMFRNFSFWSFAAEHGSMRRPKPWPLTRGHHCFLPIFNSHTPKGPSPFPPAQHLDHSSSLEVHLPV